MSYEKLIEKLKSSENQGFIPPEREMEKKLTFVEFREPVIHRFRILPNKKDPEDVPYEEIFVHLVNHPNFNQLRTFLCKGKNCPICKVAKDKEKNKDPLAWKYKAQKKYIYYIEIEDKRNKPTLAMLTLTYYAQEELKKVLINQLKAGINVWDLSEGRWIEMSMKKISEKRQYSAQVASELDEVDDQYVLSWYKEIKPLHEFYRDYSIQELEKIVKGEKIDLKNSNQNQSTQVERPRLKDNKVENTKIKFDSDEVDSIDDIPDYSDDTPANMKRLEDIMSQTEDDFED